MNERIRELAEQAQKVIWSANEEVTELTDLDVEKFAELIVKECASLVKGFEISHELAGQEGNYMHYEASSILKEHFGVE